MLNKFACIDAAAGISLLLDAQGVLRQCRRQGLSLPLDSFSIDFWSDEQITISFSSPDQNISRRWRFWSFSPSLEHVVAFCAEHGGEQLGLTVKEVVPLDFDRPVEGIRDERAVSIED